MISARIVADSIYAGSRLTTFECVLPKRDVAEFNTHGVIRRNSASSRAIPTMSVIEQVERDPFMPLVYRYAQKGMQPAEAMTPQDAAFCADIIDDLREYTIRSVRLLAMVGQGRGLAKEDLNRYLEPWMWTTIVATATEWDGFWYQRDSPNASATFEALAGTMHVAYRTSVPIVRGFSGPKHQQWHLPYVTEAERASLPVQLLPPLSARRVAGVSYLVHGLTRGVRADLDRFISLVEKCHWSPLEGPARCGSMPTSWYGPYQAWKPLRKFYGGESMTTRFGTQKDDGYWSVRRPDIERLLSRLENVA